VVSAGANHNIEVGIVGSEGMTGLPILPVFGRWATVHNRVRHRIVIENPQSFYGFEQAQ